MERDYNHPSIVGWCPFNETWDIDGRKQNDIILETVYRASKALDKTRPVIDTSGNYHVVTDIYDVHFYEQDPQKFAEIFKTLGESGEFEDFMPRQQYKKGQHFFVSEYGGTAWSAENGWGYGNAPKSEEEWFERVRALCLNVRRRAHLLAGRREKSARVGVFSRYVQRQHRSCDPARFSYL